MGTLGQNAQEEEFQTAVQGLNEWLGSLVGATTIGIGRSAGIGPAGPTICGAKAG